MRACGFLAAGLLATLSGCGRHADTRARASGPAPARSAQSGLRREGLWVQTVSRDGKPGGLGRMRLCIDAATDSRMSLVGRAAGRARCTRKIEQPLDGGYRFQTTCDMGRGGRIVSTGAVWSDFRSTYRVHAESEVQGAMFTPLNGRHTTDVTARYLGPCPSDMAPGEVILGPGLKVNLNHLPLSGVAAALG